MSSDGDNPPTLERVGQALNIAVHGNRSRVVVTNAQASGESSTSVTPTAGQEPGLFRTAGRLIGTLVAGLATVAGTAAAVWLLLK